MIKRRRTISLCILSFIVFMTGLIVPKLQPAKADTKTAQKSVYKWQGYFKNPEYSNPEVFLANGKQTDAQSSKFKEMLKNINDKKDLTTITDIYSEITKIPYKAIGEKFSTTTDQILARGNVNGCTDYALVFASLARAKGIPTVFVQTARIDWIKDYNQGKGEFLIGHNLVEVYIKGEWYLVDSTAGKLYMNYDKSNFNLDDGYIVFAKSLEIWDSGAKDSSQNTEVMKRLFKNYNLKNYKQPYYYFINLLNFTKSKAFVADPSQNISAAPNSGGSSSEQKKDIKVLLIGSKEEMDSVAGYLDLSLNSMFGSMVNNYEKVKSTVNFKTLIYFRKCAENPPDSMKTVIPASLKEGMYNYNADGKKVIVIVSDDGKKRLELLKKVSSNMIE